MPTEAPPPYSTQSESVPNASMLGISLSTDPTNNELLVSLVPPREPSCESGKTGGKRAPVDICCVIDVSASMTVELKAILEEGAQNVESTGLNTLDVVKHAVRTIMATMEQDDRIAIVSFSQSAKIVVGLTQMTAANKTQVLQAVQGLQIGGNTNLWDGLKTGMGVLNAGLVNEYFPPPQWIKNWIYGGKGSLVGPSPISSARLSSLFLLTDGMPNNNPPRGIIPMLESYLTSHPPRFNIHTFGFGYSLDSQLLLNISRLGRGLYGFIPDASSLGATFIHAVANLYSTCADHVQFTIEYPTSEGHSKMEGRQLEVIGVQDVTYSSSSITVNVGTVQYGQNKDFVFKLKNFSESEGAAGGFNLLGTVRYRPWTRKHSEGSLECIASLSCQEITEGGSEEDRARLQYHSKRLEFVSIVDGMFRGLIDYSDVVSTFEPRLKKLLSSLDSPLSGPSAIGLKQDIAGEVLLALSSAEKWGRWGRHYLPSLARYHLLQQCGSYRDSGLQVYGSESPLFTASRDALDEAFDNLPPPEPSVIERFHSHTSPPGGPSRHTLVGSFTSSFRSSPITSMSVAFASRSGPCFDGACLITLADGRNALVSALRRGMRVQTPKGPRAVIAVLETSMQGGEALLCELPGGLRITPWHPIKTFVETTGGGEWVFPIDRVAPKVLPCKAVYSLLLEPDEDPEAHGVYIQGVQCVTLGHGIYPSCSPSIGLVEDPRNHIFLGDYARIVHSLSSFPLSHDGIYRIDRVLKDDMTGHICGFLPCEEKRGFATAEFAPGKTAVLMT